MNFPNGAGDSTDLIVAFTMPMASIECHLNLSPSFLFLLLTMLWSWKLVKLRTNNWYIHQMETAESYLDAVKKAGILVDMQERKAKILRDSNLLARSVGGHLTSPGSLLQEVVNLVEAPLPILGQFDASFLELQKIY
uniref:glycine--tRNA ligase n=1 Tax=Ananas comosus var. bracteatus TaxID=296719 RepID=A0A6V7Q2N6_ANACO|nr:unnamed protein product [Ananas comosus var. bracteatus]